MAQRSQQAQPVHDAVISARESTWKTVSGYAQSWTNPGTEQRWSYKLNGAEQFSDIIIQPGMALCGTYQRQRSQRSAILRTP